jgi:hypothetical protein
LSVFVGKLDLVSAGHRARMLLVEPHVLQHGHPTSGDTGQQEARGAHGTAQTRRDHQVELCAIGLESATGLTRLCDAARRQVNIDPARETVGQVPLTLPVPH